MVSIDDGYVDSAAPNSDAAKNGRGLVIKNKFTELHISPDESILFGECQGSGKEPYRCSSDFLRPEQPTHRCSCPSRQFPCKHCLGLMYAYSQKKPFTTAEVPDDLQAKRDKIVARVEKKAAEVAAPKQVNKGALAKKIQAQLDGIGVLQKLTHDLVRLGIGNMNAKLAKEIEEQAKQLGNSYLPGAQAALQHYTKLFAGDDGKFTDQASTAKELIYSEGLDQLGRLQTLAKQGKAYLQRRLDDAELKPETDSSIAAWLGHAWQLRELKEAGLVENNVELIQLAFNSHDDIARQEFVDTGVWIALGTGKIRLTQTFRPYKAVKYIKSDDSFLQVAQVKELCVYPGDVNPRIRWEGMLPRPLEPGDLEKIRGFGQGDCIVRRSFIAYAFWKWASSLPPPAGSSRRPGRRNGICSGARKTRSRSSRRFSWARRSNSRPASSSRRTSIPARASPRPRTWWSTPVSAVWVPRWTWPANACKSWRRSAPI